MERKPLPIGVEDFGDVKRTSLYIDKTFLIKDIVKRTPSSAILYTRPRRFGKSLALSMLKYFFEISGEDKAPLFEDTEIYKDKDIWNEHFSAYPVVYLNFKDVNEDDEQSLLRITKTCLLREYERHGYLLDSPALSDRDKKYFHDVLSLSLEDADFSSSLERLTHFLFLHHKKRAIVLIDEYDTPIRIAYEKGFYDGVIGFFRRLFGAALKGNPCIHYAVLTGILQISKESIFSGLNNLVVNNVVKSPSKEAFGFSQEEVDALLEEYGMAEMKEEFRDWYDGYLFGKNKVYNPWSVLNAVQDESLEPYWSNTSEAGGLGNLLTNENFGEDELIGLLTGKEIRSEINLSISYKDIDSSCSYLLSYLLATGYLTVKEKVDDLDGYILRIPNKEIESIFRKEIIQRYLPVRASNLPSGLSSAFLDRDEAKIKLFLEEHVLKAFSYYDLNREKEYQTMMIALLIASLRGYKIRSEVNAGSGRSYIIAYGGKTNPSLIIEIKSFKDKTSSSRLKEAATKALEQIADRDYISEVSDSLSEKVICYGLAFAYKSVEVSSLEIEL